MTIHHFDGTAFEIEIDKENTVAVFHMEVTGDEILCILKKDGSEEYYDTADMSESPRNQDYLDSYYFVPKEEW